MTDLVAIAAAAVQRYAETHPRPTHVTQSQAAEMLGLSKPTVCKRVKEGVLRTNRFGMIPIEVIDEARSAEG